MNLRYSSLATMIVAAALVVGTVHGAEANPRPKESINTNVVDSGAGVTSASTRSCKEHLPAPIIAPGADGKPAVSTQWCQELFIPASHQLTSAKPSPTFVGPKVVGRNLSWKFKFKLVGSRPFSDVVYTIKKKGKEVTRHGKVKIVKIKNSKVYRKAVTDVPKGATVRATELSRLVVQPPAKGSYASYEAGARSQCVGSKEFCTVNRAAPKLVRNDADTGWLLTFPNLQKGQIAKVEYGIASSQGVRFIVETVTKSRSGILWIPETDLFVGATATKQ